MAQTQVSFRLRSWNPEGTSDSDLTFVEERRLFTFEPASLFLDLATSLFSPPSSLLTINILSVVRVVKVLSRMVVEELFLVLLLLQSFKAFLALLSDFEEIFLAWVVVTIVSFFVLWDEAGSDTRNRKSNNASFFYFAIAIRKIKFYRLSDDFNIYFVGVSKLKKYNNSNKKNWNFKQSHI